MSNKEIARVTVGGIAEYAIVLVDEIIHQGRNVLAVWRSQSRKILIRSGLHPQEAKAALCHELLHAWRYHCPPPENLELMLDWYSNFCLWFDEALSGIDWS